MSQKTKFAAAAKACRGISSRAARNRCMSSKLKGRGYADLGSPRGRSHRGWKKRRGRGFHGSGTVISR